MRCYFNLVEAHQTIVDDEGIEVDDLDEACVLALDTAVAMIQEGEVRIEDWRGWKLKAADASGATLFVIRLDRFQS